jgi:radical SAM protein with 4Fe4S-binding SPASM domain
MDDIVYDLCSTHLVANPALLANGDITPCMDAKNKSPIIGKIKESTIEIFESYHDEVKKLCKDIYFKCKDCIAYPFCKGGCPVKFINDIDSEVKSACWECQMIINYWKYIYNEILTRKKCFNWHLVKIYLPGDADVFIYKMEKLIQNNENM